MTFTETVEPASDPASDELPVVEENEVVPPPPPAAAEEGESKASEEEVQEVVPEKSEEDDAPVDSYEVLDAPTQDEQVESSAIPMDESKETSDNNPSQAPENGNLPDATNPTVKPCYPSEYTRLFFISNHFKQALRLNFPKK